jgi:PAS domain S-box-containing protein
MALPQTQDRVAEMTAQGEAVLNHTTLSNPERQKFAIYARMLKEDDMERIIGSVQTSMNENPNEYGFNPTLVPRVQPALNEYSQATAKFIDLTNHIVDSPNLDVTAKEYLLAGSAASATSFKLWRLADEELDKLLQIRIESYQRRRTKSLFVAGGALMAAIGFVTFITRAISGPLKRQASELQSANEALQGEIAERKRVEAALRTAEEQYRSIFENAVEGIFQTTRDGHYLVANPTLARMYGYDSVAELQASVTDIGSGLYVKPQRREEFQRLIEQTGKIHRFESEIYRKDGSVIWISEHARGVYDEAGAVLYYEGTVEDITERKRHEEVLEKMNKQLIDTSRRAGMAEVATGVLHNVGNVLNSVNVSALLITDRLSKSRVSHLAQVSATLRANAGNLGAFITADPKGSKIPGFIASLAERLGNEQAELLREAEGLSKNIAHIKDIVAVQQNYAKVSGVVEVLPAAGLVDDALEMNGAAFDRHRVEVLREFDSVPAVRVEKHKVLQILINVIRNAKYAVSESRRLDKRITVSIRRNGNNCVKIAVADNGIGIAPEILTRIFAHGFTTKTDGHGFGLHCAALAAKELGGSLFAHSEGVGQGATFTLELPIDIPSAS